MIKWFAYIVVLLIFAPCLSSAKNKCNDNAVVYVNTLTGWRLMATDTSAVKKQKPEQIKEVTKARKQPKPEKVEPADNTATAKPKPKPKRQRRPEGLERPPEIPRRNGN